METNIMSLLKSDPAFHVQPATSAAIFAGGLADEQTWQQMPQQELVTLCLDTDLLDALQATGEDWESLFNDTLRQWLKAGSVVL